MFAKQDRISRRGFLKTTAAVGGGLALPAWFLEESQSYAATPKSASPNDKPGIAWIGCGGRGRGISKEAAAYGNVVAVCDVDAKRLEEAAKMFPGAKTYNDFRKAIDRDDVHVIVNATPDHWHTLVNLRALKASKDIYSEKPLTLTIEEGRKLVATVKETKRILQTGSQQRSDARFRLACELVRNGRIGNLRQVTTILPAGSRGGPFAEAPVPKELDWDFWMGQTPKVEYVPQRCHASFRFWYEYSGGTMTDWGAHHNDIALWGMGLERSGPLSIDGKALLEPVSGGFTIPSEYRVEYYYANGVKHICLSTASDDPSGGVVKQDGLHNGIKFEGTGGWIFVTRGKIEASKPELLSEPLPAKAEKLYVSANHMGNFFDCVRSRKPPICDAEIGHRSASVCHLGVISIRLGRRLNWNPEKEAFVNDQQAESYVAREMRKPWSYDTV
jgi:predicted dehydrogenase